MKLHLSLFCLIPLFACETKVSSNQTDLPSTQPIGINISIDTLNVPMNGRLGNVVWFNDNFYGMFETMRRNTTGWFKKMIVFNPEGEVIEDVFLPKEIQNMVYCKLIINQDRLYVKETQFQQKNLVLGEYVADFQPTETKNFPIFKDSLYNIYSVCNGEFGGSIYFENRLTGKSYEAGSTCAIIVNKLDDEYYVTNNLAHMFNFVTILKITDPGKLANSDLSFDIMEGSHFSEGTELLLDTVSIEISTSFVSDNKLLHLYSDKRGTYIGEIVNKKLMPVYKFDFDFTAAFNQQVDNEQQILTCLLADNKSAILVIETNRFIFYILN